MQQPRFKSKKSQDERDVPRIKCWRQLSRDDVESVKRLIRVSTRVLFGIFDPDRVIELSSHQIVVENVAGEITSGLCLRPGPNVARATWRELVAQNVSCRKLTTANTLFVHLMVWDDRYDWDWVVAVLRSLYLAHFHLQYVAIVAPHGAESLPCFKDRMLAKYLYQIPFGKQPKRPTMEVFVSMRSRTLPSLRIRRAVVEDNDDLVAMLERTTPKIRARYGEFFIAEIIQELHRTRDVIVAEFKNDTVGMLSFNTNVNLELLDEVYDLRAFNFLQRYAPVSADGSLAQPEEIATPSDDTDASPQAAAGHRKSVALNWVANAEHSPSTSDHVPVDEPDTTAVIRKSVWQDMRNMRLSSCSDSDDDDTAANPSMSELASNPLAGGRSQKSQQSNLASESVLSVDDEHARGESNCFAVELHAMHTELDGRMVVDVLQASFEAYPEREYCVLTVPTTQMHTPLVAHFVPVFCKRSHSFEPRSSLYVLHRNALSSEVTVRTMRMDTDREAVAQFLGSMVHGRLVSEALASAADETPSVQHHFIIEMEKQIIGIASIEALTDFRTLVIDYKVRALMNKNCYNKEGESGLLRTLIVQPAFAMRAPHIFSELLRKCNCSVLFFKMPHGEQQTAKELPPINTLLAEMRPILPRIRVHYNLDDLRECQHPPAYARDGPDLPNRFALYAHTVASCARRKLHINERIVVVGCSQTAIAFFENLLFNERTRDVWFTHLTLVSPLGLAGMENEDVTPLARHFEDAITYRAPHIKRLGLGAWVYTVYGMVTKIDRYNRFVLVDGRKRVYYDRLYMFCGLQYDYPVGVKVPPRAPKNVAFVNNTLDAHQMLQNTQRLQEGDKDYDIIVYGDNVETYTCLDVLLRSGVPEARLTHVRPRVALASGTFNDPYVHSVMRRVLAASSMYQLENCDLTDWKYEPSSGCVSKLNVESDLNIFELPCSLLVSFERQNVNRSTIMAINEAGLVFDGRLVIDENYQTSDPHIFAAGPMTKFRRDLYADNCCHQFVCSREVGARLAERTLDAISPVHAQFPKGTPWVVDPVLLYRNPKVLSRPVLGRLYFVCVQRPTQPLPYDLAKNMATYGTELITGMVSDGDPLEQPVSYCRIHLDQYNFVSTIVCLTNEELDIFKYKELWGKHESSFSNMKLRFEQKFITDLHQYLRLPWSYLLSHDTYNRGLRETNRQIVLTMVNDDPKMLKFLKDAITNNKWQKLDEKQRLQFAEEFIMSSYDSATNAANIDFIVEHIDELPMYFDPLRTTITFEHD